MNIAEIETELATLADDEFDPASFPFRLLEIYHAPKATLSKLRQGSANHAVEPGDLLWKNKLFFRPSHNGNAAETVDEMMQSGLIKKHNPRFILSTDGTEFYCKDVKSDQFVYSDYSKLNDNFLFLMPLAGIERYEAPDENPADIKATARIARLYDAILDANSDWIERDYTHDLNQFMTRLLFCFFAEDTSIFEKDLFTSIVLSLSNEDGTDTDLVLKAIFSALKTKPENREGLPDYARRFPYVNGGLFRDDTRIPKFSKRARRLLKECGELYWKEINPDIFGSMVQAVAQPGLREDMGLHYTSVPNIIKALQPLFLISLEEELQEATRNEIKLKKLLNRIYKIRVFDPACGSGNFLIIAYKELRRLEMRIFGELKTVVKQWSLPLSGIRLVQFYGIEITDFAVETAKLSLWIAEYQMNELFKATFGSAPPSLPLQESGSIRHGNAADTDWIAVCPPDDTSETFIVGNPPFEGARGQSENQKIDIQKVLGSGYEGANSLDYVCIWFHRAAEYIDKSPAQAAFVATSSICQGQSVSLFWAKMIQRPIEIGFAHLPFKWRNNASRNAAVTCVIVGIRRKSNHKKVLFNDSASRVVANISPYLTDTDNIVVSKRTSPPDGLPALVLGNQAIDGGFLIMSKLEMDEIVSERPEASKYFRPLYGASNFVDGIPRYCIWVSASALDDASRIPALAARFKEVEAYRATGGEVARSLVHIPYRFRYIHEARAIQLVVPRTSTEKRDYIACGLLDQSAIVTDAIQVIYDPELYLFSILSSKMHMAWLKAVGGKFKTDPRYSNTLVYNTFPLPELSPDQKAELEEHAYAIIGAREAHPGRSLGWLYDPETMPEDLLKEHHHLDVSLENIYIGRSFKNDIERLEHLFKLYAARIKKESRLREKSVKRSVVAA